MAARKRNEKRAGSNAGTVFWLAVIVIVLFIFALNWGKVQETLARTNFHEIVKTQSGAEKPPSAPAKPKAETPQAEMPQATTPQAATPQAATPKAETPPSATQPQAWPRLPEPPIAATPKPEVAVPATGGEGRTPVGAQAARLRSASLFFVRVDDDGTIVRQEVKRSIAVSDSPLMDSLDALLKGPTEDEIRKKLISLVPEGTKLLSAQVRGSTAFLNFNEAFMYNHYGIEGYAGQLKQVVYTATSFPTVQDVQILIEGERHDYLGGEGVYIGRPLSRNSF